MKDIYGEHQQCKIHAKSLQIYCVECRLLACSKCFLEHKKKGCAGVFPLIAYAEEELLPKYRERIEDFKNSSSTKSFFEMSKIIKADLARLKGKLENSFSIINDSLDLLEMSESDSPLSKETIEKNLNFQYEELKNEIESENMDYIVNAINNPVKNKIGDSEKHLTKALNEAIEMLEDFMQLISLNELLKEFNSSYRSLANNHVPSHKYIYGVCDPIDSCRMLSFCLVENLYHVNVVALIC
eukprot:TRINITY_DN1701_c0_g3_i1.p1 TRINITY_DN1701_c0_g3~~TRINITY_DN1701_c0_g3_i1.p1  ORF type:complete len:267 (+),score=37.76 TRINITY_DN1701_c0_g3_i1:80-802(+)